VHMHVHSQASGPGQDHHSHAGLSRAYAWGVGLNLAFVAAEVTFGFASGSLALLADAGHNASDVLGLLLSWACAVLARGAASERRTYGLRRTTILAALLNAVLLLVGVGGIVWEAMTRLMHPAPVAAGTVIVVAAAGVIINGVSAALFHGRHQDLNARGAYLHLLTDAGVSLGVVAAGFGIRATGWLWLDPVTSLIIAAAILLSTWHLLRDSLDLALDAVPSGIDPAAVRSFLLGLPTVAAVHDLHVWGMSTSEAALTAHLVVGSQANADDILSGAAGGLRSRFGIGHSTIQIETQPCTKEENCLPSKP
jgi:cobalt-zinc-cadmium efflux system protein